MEWEVEQRTWACARTLDVNSKGESFSFGTVSLEEATQAGK